MSINKNWCKQQRTVTQEYQQKLVRTTADSNTRVSTETGGNSSGL